MELLGEATQGAGECSMQLKRQDAFFIKSLPLLAGRGPALPLIYDKASLTACLMFGFVFPPGPGPCPSPQISPP